ncbi:hypothetical protein Hanom_Chr14g01246881 [Helianthus anomalus]
MDEPTEDQTDLRPVKDRDRERSCNKGKGYVDLEGLHYSFQYGKDHA